MHAKFHTIGPEGGVGSGDVSCRVLQLSSCTLPESEMKAEGERLEGVEVLTITEADDGTRTHTIEETRV